MLDSSHILSKQHGIYMKEHLQSNYLLLGDPTSMSAEDVEDLLLRGEAIRGRAEGAQLAR